VRPRPAASSHEPARAWPQHRIREFHGGASRNPKPRHDRGRSNADITAKGYVFGLNVPVGAGAFKAAYGTQKVGDTTTVQKVGLGYHYSLSKRTLIYTDVGHDSKASTAKTGYDLGIRHTF
jgi:predicted porin